MVKLALIGLVVTALIEALLWLKLFWFIRKLIAVIVILSLPVFSGLYIGSLFNAWTVLIVYFGIYRVVNMLRIIEGRTEIKYLANVVRRSSGLLMLLQLILFLGYYLNIHWHSPANFWVYIVLVGQTFIGLVLLYSTSRNLKHTKSSAVGENIKLPALTVAIPARNETKDLLECLTTIVASSYQKMEVLVLDDCSQNKHTSRIIQSFANDGVRFIAGQKPPKQWTAKNFAYEQLAKEANGEYILFCGVDSRFEKDTLKLITQSLLAKKKKMLSVMPVNLEPSNKLSLLFQPVRYMWELILPRRLLNRPPVLSTCWVISKEFFNTVGGFGAVERSIIPESYFAKEAVKANDGYSFLRSTAFGLKAAKSLKQQFLTTERTRYPQLHRRPELVSLLVLSEFTLALSPIIYFIYGLFHHNLIIWLLSLVLLALNVIFYVVFVKVTYQKFFWSALILMPLAAIVDLFMVNYSMYMYEFREVIWKGRNICLPVMRSI